MNSAKNTQLLDRQGSKLSPLTHLESLFYETSGGADSARASLSNILVLTNPSTSFSTGTPSSNAIISYVTLNTSATFGTTGGLIEIRAEQYNFNDLLTRSQNYINLNSSIQGLNSSIQDLQSQIDDISTGSGGDSTISLSGTVVATIDAVPNRTGTTMTFGYTTKNLGTNGQGAAGTFSLSQATQTQAGLMSASDKVNLDSLVAGGGSGEVDIEAITQSVLAEVNSQLPGLVSAQVNNIISDISINISIVAANIP